jgi:hypothetical protein
MHIKFIIYNRVALHAHPIVIGRDLHVYAHLISIGGKKAFIVKDFGLNQLHGDI